MAFPPLLLIALAFIGGTAISHEGHGGTCGPFGLTTTSGILYSAPNGTQLPRNSWNPDGLEEGGYLIWDNGTITNYNGSLCEFRPFLVCLPTTTHSAGDGVFAIGQYGRLSYANNDTFNRCSPTVKDGPIFEDMRIFPGGSSPGAGSGIASCDVLAMQASRCHPGHPYGQEL